MRQHDNHKAFESVPFFMWTNSSTHIYVNVGYYTRLIGDFQRLELEEDHEFTVDDALKAVRAYAMTALRHELRHVKDFQDNQNRPPTTWKQMIDFEATAYGGDVNWLSNDLVKNFLVNDIGARASVVDFGKASHGSTAALFVNWQGSLTDEKTRKAQLVKAEYLPKAIGEKLENTKYLITDLYATKAP